MNLVAVVMLCQGLGSQFLQFKCEAYYIDCWNKKNNATIKKSTADGDKLLGECVEEKGPTPVR